MTDPTGRLGRWLGPVSGVLFVVAVVTGGAVFMGTASAGGLAYRALPIWLGIFAAVVAVGALVPWLGILVFVGWVLAASISDLIRPSRPTPRVTSG